MHELRGTAEPTLPELVAHLSACDLLLIEGFKHEAIPKLEVHRAVVGEPLLLFRAALVRLLSIHCVLALVAFATSAFRTMLGEGGAHEGGEVAQRRAEVVPVELATEASVGIV